MPLIYFPSQDTPLNDILDSNVCDKATLEKYNSLPCNTLLKDKAYCLSTNQGDAQSKLITSVLNGASSTQSSLLADTIDLIEQDALLLSEFFDKQLSNISLQNLSSGLGSSTTATSHRLTEFQRALAKYQNAVINLHQLKRNPHPSRYDHARRATTHQRVKTTYIDLQKRFSIELQNISSKNYGSKTKGSILSSAERGIALANGRRSRRLYIENVEEAKKLRNLSSHLSSAGNKLIVIDAAIRTHRVLDIKERGGNWKKEAAIEASGFGASVAGGLAAAKLSTSLLMAIGLGMTPVGWVILIGIATTASFATAYYVDNKAKETTRSLLE